MRDLRDLWFEIHLFIEDLLLTVLPSSFAVN